MKSKKILSLLLAAIIASGGISKTAMQVYADTPSPSSSANSSEEDSSEVLELTELSYINGVSFYDWMLANYLEEDSPRGDFANDMLDDDSWPKENTKEAILSYMSCHNACQPCIETFRACWKDYKKYYRDTM